MMARFNAQNPEDVRVENEAGGLGFQKSPKLELALLLLTSFVKDQHYRSAAAQLKRLRELVPLVGTEFAAKAAVYARQDAGMRSITHALAAEIGHVCKGEKWLRPFFKAVIRRPDDVTEILAAWSAAPGGTRTGVPGVKPLRKLPKGMQRGLADALAGFNEYQLAKYRGEGKAISLIDAVRVLHPKPLPKNAEAFKKLVAGDLVSSETWEAKLTKSGQQAKAVAAETGVTEDEAKAVLKGASWTEMLEAKKLPYFALLRNLRNIAEQAPGALPMALEQLVDAVAIKKSLVMPFRFQTAYRQFTERPGSQEILRAISKACDLSVANVPKFPGRTLVALDGSGSMRGPGVYVLKHAQQPPDSPWNIGKLFTAVLALANNADVVVWGEKVTGFTVNPLAPVVMTAEALDQTFQNSGTSMGLILGWMLDGLKKGEKPYDRVIVLTDNESWLGDLMLERAAYHKLAGKLPSWWTFDLQGYSSLQVKEQGSYVVGGFSEKVFDVMAKIESDPTTLIAEIENMDAWGTVGEAIEA